MWNLKNPEPVKLIFGILADSQESLNKTEEMIAAKFGSLDLASPTWPFTHTKYYEKETGSSIIKKFLTVEKLICPDQLADIKIKTNKMEEKLANSSKSALARPVNIDPGYIEPAKLILASTKNFAHRIYIGKQIWAEVTLTYNKGKWQSFAYTFPDHEEDRYHGFFSKVREKLVQQLRAGTK